MKSPREVLKKLYESAFENSVKSSYMMEQNPYGIDTALSDLSEIVMARLKENICISPKHDSERGKGYRDCITDIAKLFTDKGETK